MCDTFVALPSHTASGNLIFGKNSDREPNEAQAIVRFPSTETHSNTVRCTFIEIPQVPFTYEVILSKPFQMWGAEMGANEHGVVIGNEAVFTKIKRDKSNNGLTGMDLVRLALERCRTAKSALQTITGLLETYGQNACGGYQNSNFFYHNSFIIADGQSAWVLETADRHWAALRVDGFRSISNGLTIESDYDLISTDAIDFAIRKGWAKPRDQFSFRKAYSDWLYTKGSNCRRRQQRSMRMGQSKSNRFDVYYAIEILSSHDCDAVDFRPSKSGSSSICMHPTGMTNPSQTNGSMVAEIRTTGPSTIWLTGTSMPCLSVYVPYFFAEPDSKQHPLSDACWNVPGPQLDTSLWWQAERLHREVCRNYSALATPFQDFRREMQHQLLIAEKRLCPSGNDRQEISRKASEHVRTFIRNKNAEPSVESKPNTSYLYRHYWKRMNRKVGLE